MKKIVAAVLITVMPLMAFADEKTQVVTGNTPSQGAKFVYDQSTKSISPMLWMVSVRSKK